MAKPANRVLRIGGGTLVLIAIVAGLYIAFSFWMADFRRDLAANSEIASTALGEIEYAIAGEGDAVLSIHGSPGGYDVSIAGPRARPASYEGRKIIAVSRPGFLRTPLSSGRTPEEQADLYAALLDELGISQVVVSGISGGGPSALQFAIRHPGRTRGLILTVPHLVQKGGDPDFPVPSGISAHLKDFGMWVVGGITPWVAPFAMKGFDGGDPVQVARMQEMAPNFLMSAERGPGRSNDKAQYLHVDMDAWPLDQMTVPVLLFHGTADTGTPYAGSARAAERIPNARLVTFEGYDHLVFVARHREIDQHVRAFMAELPPAR
jgi:2-hydroxy-6-oxonona-2,4-dienedioate hydrolase